MEWLENKCLGITLLVIGILIFAFLCDKFDPGAGKIVLEGCWNLVLAIKDFFISIFV